ncbi:MAG: KH domain-containing protein [Oscillospiraceae bacterium]|jgi:predicted RNA-binding protein YlqC (UPF0109 family)|nr:KH domain-containing protein [Oscillospiraceae bacterium]
MKDLLVYIAKQLADRTDEISVTERELESGTVFVLRVASGDMGKIIGRHGRMAKDIRTLMRAAGKRQGKRVSVEIMG